VAIHKRLVNRDFIREEIQPQVIRSNVRPHAFQLGNGALELAASLFGIAASQTDLTADRMKLLADPRRGRALVDRSGGPGITRCLIQIG
jgi:hypothetical protein